MAEKKLKLVRNILSHMRGKSVLVNGTQYTIDESGYAEVAEADAAKMLQGHHWKPVSRRPAREPAAPEREQAPVQEAPPSEPGETSDSELESEEAGENLKSEEESPAVPLDTEGSPEYPDPTMDMSKSELREIAAAYQIEYEPRTTKKELVDLITAAMYPAEDGE